MDKMARNGASRIARMRRRYRRWERIEEHKLIKSFEKYNGLDKRGSIISEMQNASNTGITLKNPTGIGKEERKVDINSASFNPPKIDSKKIDQRV